MKFFPTMTKGQFSAATTYYTSGKSGLEHARFWEYTANALERYMKTGRVDFINNMVTAALSAGRYRNFTRVTKALCAHEFDTKTRKFTGKADKAKLKKLRKEDADGVAKWEALLYEHLVKETEFQQEAPKKDWSMETKVLALVKQCVSHEVSLKDVQEALVKDWAKVESEKATA